MDTQSTTTIRPLAPRDRVRWIRLLTGFACTTGAQVDAATARATWSRLMDEAVPIHGLCAVEGAEEPIGIVHYQTLYRATVDRPICQLSELYVEPDHRGRGVGQRLVQAVVDRAAAAEIPEVRWWVRDSNLSARKLYDRIAARTEFRLYEVPIAGVASAATENPPPARRGRCRA